MFHPIRVAHVALQLETGGMERLLAEFARHADRKRVSLSFISIGKRGRTADDLESCGWPVTVLNRPPGLSPSIMFQLAHHFHREKIDIVHTHNSKPLLYAGPAARLAGVGGVVHTCHGRRQGATRRQNLAFKLASHCADRMVCVSRDITRLCLDEWTGLETARTILNGIDLQRFSFKGPAAEGPAIYVGRLSPEKDVANLLHATALVVAQCPAFRLQIAGTGKCQPQLTTLTESLGIKADVDFLGDVQDVPALLHQASMLVLPSLTEGVPLTVLEAMACGLPVVATRVGGTPEVVIDGVTGLLVSPGDPMQMADAILRVYHQREIAGKMGRAGRARAEAHFDVREMVRSYESLYPDVLQDRQMRAA